METEAVSEVEKNPLKYEHGIVLYNPEWNVGLVGIVASKIVNKYHKPTLIIGKNGDIFKGSGRSYGNANLKTILDGCKELFVSYGGHSMAAGVTIKNDCLMETNEVFNKACQKYYEVYGKSDEISYFDVAIPLREVNINNAVLLLDNLYPYCVQNNFEPVFLLKNVTITNVRAYSGKGWRSLNFIAEKNGEKTPLRLRMFSNEFGTEVEGKRADIYFSFPQTIATGNSKISPQCNIIELQLLK
jgi:single-stranded-DNA-specific exonuclease